MGEINLKNVNLTKLQIIPHDKGNILKGLDNSELDFESFGEAYFSKINSGEIKGWKFHKKMKLNLLVPIGNVRFVFYDFKNDVFREEVIGDDNYCRLTVPPKLWFAFQGLSKSSSLVLNIASITHNPEESISKPIETFAFNWENLN
jgi:dTDP-4-dehydrorhamnose 3,5-epimerase